MDALTEYCGLIYESLKALEYIVIVDVVTFPCCSCAISSFLYEKLPGLVDLTASTFRAYDIWLYPVVRASILLLDITQRPP